MESLKGMAYLRRKLSLKRDRVQLRYKYYDMKNKVQELNVSTPDGLKWLNEVLGWCGTAVNAISDRLVFREFRDDNFGMQQIFNLNNPDVLFDSAILGALISSCDFIYISPDKNGFPRLQVIDGGNATGEIDPVTGLLKEGYAVLRRDSDTGAPVLEAYFLPHATYYYGKGMTPFMTDHSVEYPLLVPVIYRPDATRPFGHSVISRSCMGLVNGAARTLKRSEITAEFYSFPQKYATGVDRDMERMESWKATISSMLYFEVNEAGEHPVLGQFQQATAAPHLEQFKLFASAFAGETGLTLDDLGFPTANPSSAEAIKAAHETLRLKARKAQRTFSTGFLNAGYLAACLRDNYAYKREQIYMTTLAWEPTFQPDAAGLTGLGDATIKIQQAFPGYFTEEKLRDIMGI